MRNIRLMSLVLALSLGLPGLSHAVLPQTMNYQGRLTLLSGGAPVPDSTGNSVDFALWDAVTSGNQVWSESWVGNVTTKNGLFNIVLGAQTPLPNSAFKQPVWLEITWHNGATPETLAPRQPLVMAPYAFSSKQLDMPFSQASPLSNT